MTRLTPEVITAIHSPPAGLGNQRTPSGALERGKARSRRAGALAGVATGGGGGAANSVYCACSTSAALAFGLTSCTSTAPSGGAS